MSLQRSDRRPARNSQSSGHSLRRLRRVRPLLEALDDRCLLSTITVTTAADNGDNNAPPTGSLRRAIIEANFIPGPTTINFNIGPGNHDIELAAALPAITADGVTIDGTTEPDSVLIDGQNAGNVAGLDLKGNNCTVQGLIIGNCESSGILVEGTGDAIDSCQIGVNGDFPNSGNGDGVYAFQAKALTIQSSFIEGNNADGIAVFAGAGISIHDNIVEDNHFDGLRVLSSAADYGQAFATSVRNNVFNGSGGNGVHLVNSSDNIIGDLTLSNLDGNTIGDDGENLPIEGNSGDGVLIESSGEGSSTNNTIIGNSIAGNDGNGVHLADPGTTSNSLFNNDIGIAFTGQRDTTTRFAFLDGNRLDGVAISGGSNNNHVGGAGLFLFDKASNGYGNVIVGNLNDGVHMSDPGTSGNTVQGNLIGVYADVNGERAESNDQSGVTIDNGATNNQVGGSDGTAIHTGLGNLISGNVLEGVGLADAGTSGNEILGNFIGTDSTGTLEIHNLAGVRIYAGASNNEVGLAYGLTGRDLGNVISGNLGDGVLIYDAGTSGNLVQSNEIGTTPSGNTALPNDYDGVKITGGASGNTVGGPDQPAIIYLPGNVISGNLHDGVEISSSGTADNMLEGDLIGTDSAGLHPLANSLDGVFVSQGAGGNLIGGGLPRLGNVISGNGESGVVIDTLAGPNAVVNNDIGTTLGGLSALGNGQDGVDLGGSQNGVTDNVISGNLANGVAVSGSSNFILGNEVGTNLAGTLAVPNHQDGIFMDVTTGSGLNSVGGMTQGEGNLISGNKGNGIHVTGSDSFGNLILGNKIGTNIYGNQAVANDLDGIYLDNATGYRVGGVVPLAVNLISGNLQDGVELGGFGTLDNLVLGNRIGTAANGMVAIANGRNGVHIDGGAAQNVVGGVGAADGNLISGNLADGVLIEGVVNANIGEFATQYNRILGNKIGTNVLGNAPVANHGQGVRILSASDNTVGGAVAGAGNLISGNVQSGVEVTGGSITNLFQGNFIGTNVAGTVALANGEAGVLIVQGSADNTIGGVSTNSSTPGNLISGNQGSGVVISGAGTDLNFVYGNSIGTTRYGKAVLGNKGDGVDILDGAAANRIGAGGGVAPKGPGNWISGNAGDGVRIAGRATDNNLVRGNAIGTSPSGQAGFGNGGRGVFVFGGAQHNSIGGLSAGVGNVIAFNGKAGVVIGENRSDVLTRFNPILSNSIYSNGGLGIDLANDGVTANTPGGPHNGPNDLQNTPVIETAKVSGASIKVHLLLNSTPNTTFTIQIFADAAPDPSGHGQGKTLVGTVTVTTNASGDVAGGFDVLVAQTYAGQYLTATATDASGNTSEFAKDYRAL